LQSFCDAIKRFRSDDSLRYRWLSGTDKDKENIIQELCPHWSSDQRCTR
jgi:hypothetical protein